MPNQRRYGAMPQRPAPAECQLLRAISAMTAYRATISTKAHAVACKPKNSGFQATFNTHARPNHKDWCFLSAADSVHAHAEVMNHVKPNITVVQAAPNTQPGGVHGALASPAYQSEDTPGPVAMLPMARPPKFRTPKIKKGTMREAMESKGV